MEPGKVYKVSDGSADALITLERAIEAESKMEVGKVYPLPKDPNKDLLGDNSKSDKPKNKKKD